MTTYRPERRPMTTTRVRAADAPPARGSALATWCIGIAGMLLTTSSMVLIMWRLDPCTALDPRAPVSCNPWPEVAPSWALATGTAAGLLGIVMLLAALGLDHRRSTGAGDSHADVTT